MAWIELHQSLFTHRKTVEAALLLNLPEVHLVGHLAALWTWALDNAPDGSIRAAAPVIERICQWAGEKGALLPALEQAGFLEPHPDGGYRIHDWDAYAGRLMERRKQNAERMRKTRSECPKKKPAEPVQRTCGARAPATVPNPTQPYPTPPEREECPPALRTLYEAFRAQRHPDSPAHLWTPAEWNKALPWLTLLNECGATVEALKRATLAALTRWKHAGQVTIKAIAEHWTELLEPERPPAPAPPRLSAADRRAAEWQDRTRRDLDRQLAAFDDWAESKRPSRPWEQHGPRALSRRTA